MSKIDEKLKFLEDDCIKIAESEALILKKEIDEISEKEVQIKIEELKSKLDKKFVDEENRIKQEYNKKIFDIENENKLKILNYKNELILLMDNKIKEKLIEFTKQKEYETYLINNIQNILKVISSNNYIIYLTNSDYQKYKDKIQEEYNLVIDKISDEYIGGTILEDLDNNKIINNTIKNNIEEKIKKFSKTF